MKSESKSIYFEQYCETQYETKNKSITLKWPQDKGNLIAFPGSQIKRDHLTNPNITTH